MVVKIKCQITCENGFSIVTSKADKWNIFYKDDADKFYAFMFR